MSSMIDYWTKSAKDSIDKLAEENAKLRADVAELRKPWGAFMPYEQLLSTHRSYDVTKDREWEIYQQDYARDLEVAARNEQAVVHNDSLVKRLIDTIESLGFRKEWTDHSGRRPKTYKADWLNTIRGAMPRYPGSVSQLKDNYRLKSEARNKHLEARRLAEESERRAIENHERERAKLVRMVEVATAMGLDPTREDIDTLTDELRKRDKYLDLSIAGRDTRGDWSEGCYRVSDALGRFSEATEVDREIAAEWRRLCEDFDDGRVFRDCEWSYDKVAALASPEVVALYAKLHEDT